EASFADDMSHERTSKDIGERGWHRSLATGQECVVHVADVEASENREVLRRTQVLVEAPNWISPDELILNGEGYLWRLQIRDGGLQRLDLPGLPALNNDHVPAPDGDTMYVSGYDGHIHRVVLSTGETSQVTPRDSDVRRFHFLHGVSP